jgi:hypothetical protein
MTIYRTDYATGIKNFAQPNDASLQMNAIDVNFPAVTLAVGDTIELITLPAGVTLQDYEFHFPDVDSGGPTFAFSFGVLNAAKTGLSTTYATGITAGQSNAVVRNTNSDAAQDAASNVISRRLGMLITAAATTYAGSGKTGQVMVRLRG